MGSTQEWIKEQFRKEAEGKVYMSPTKQTEEIIKLNQRVIELEKTIAYMQHERGLQSS